MNLSPEWVQALAQKEFLAVHWSQVGSPTASDGEIMEWAREHGYILFTNDLDFGALLASARTKMPSIFQFRTQNLSPDALLVRVVDHLKRFKGDLQAGAFIIIDEHRSRIRLLPFH